jgi:hypothetical protein
METNWNQIELKAYILLFAAHANFNESKKELDFIKKRVGEKNLVHIQDEFDADNDYQHIQKIESTVERLGYKKADLEDLFIEVKALFVADGEFDILEQNLFRGLKHILFA